jgi:hypothetical protein|tara:strand:- start:918 stop:1052 length:135 start_codon:yes stop_codon:yes gene_type:complete
MNNNIPTSYDIAIYQNTLTLKEMVLTKGEYNQISFISLFLGCLK